MKNVKTDPISNFIAEFQEHPLYPELRVRFKSQRPIIPVFYPQGGNEDEWKVKSGMQQGFDLCLSLLNIRGEDL